MQYMQISAIVGDIIMTPEKLTEHLMTTVALVNINNVSKLVTKGEDEIIQNQKRENRFSAQDV